MLNLSITNLRAKRKISLSGSIVLVLFVCLSSLLGCQDAAVPVQVVDSTTNEPATSEPATNEPATNEPATNEPATNEPATSEPATNEPATNEPATNESATSESATSESATTAQAEPPRDFPLGLPVLLDLGATKCIPCKMMAPILDELDEQYAGRMEVVFIDVWEDNEAGQRYGIQSIPTQIFFDAQGEELFRHEGFISKEDILAKWEELGVDISQDNSSAAAG